MLTLNGRVVVEVPLEDRPVRDFDQFGRHFQTAVGSHLGVLFRGVLAIDLRTGQNGSRARQRQRDNQAENSRFSHRLALGRLGSERIGKCR